jgi:succinyl-diaminopimelate desuccinylase
MDVARLCSDLVRIRSENPPGETRVVIEFIQSLLESWGIPSAVTEKEEGRCNLVTQRTENNLLFCGHVDVVPALDEGWSVEPYSGAILSGSVWGRGTTDMKGGCAALLAAGNNFIESHPDLPVQLAFVCDEETGGSAGIRHLIARHMIDPCDCLIAEPTPFRHPNIGQKGLVRLEMQFSGTPAHGSLYPAIGISAIMEALALLEYLRALNRQVYTTSNNLQEIITRSSQVLEEEFGMDQVSDVLTRLMFNPGVIRGGEKSNIVAQRCDLELELRVPWGCQITDLLDKIRQHTQNGKITSQTTHEPSVTDPGCRLVAVTCDAVKSIYGGDVFPIVQWAASDARHLRSAGFNVIEYGPGELQYLHAINEHVRIESLEKASDVYQQIMQKYRADTNHV